MLLHGNYIAIVNTMYLVQVRDRRSDEVTLAINGSGICYYLVSYIYRTNDNSFSCSCCIQAGLDIHVYTCLSGLWLASHFFSFLLASVLYAHVFPCRYEKCLVYTYMYVHVCLYMY